MHTCAAMHTHTCARFTCTHMRTCTSANWSVYVCLLKPGIFWYLAPPRSPLPYAACSPQLGGMVEILVALSGVIGSGDCHLPQKHGFRFGSSGAGKPKGGTEQSSGLCLVDYQFYFMFIFAFIKYLLHLNNNCSTCNMMSTICFEDMYPFLLYYFLINLNV